MAKSPAPVVAKGVQHNLATWWSTAADTDERAPELRWPRNIDVFDQMRRTDPQVMSVLRALWLPILRTTWRIDPDGARPTVTKHIAEDLGLPIVGENGTKHLNRTRDRFDFAEYLRLALLKHVFGHSYFEQVYRIAPDGRARLRKLLWLPPRTINEVSVAKDGGLEYVRQHNMPNGVRINVDEMVAHVNDREGANWLGQSLLRPAYKFWILKDRLLRIQAMTVERNGLGIPVYNAAGAESVKDDEERQKREKNEIKTGAAMARAFRSGDTAGGAIPQGASIELVSIKGKLPDAMVPIRYYDEQIARAALAHFLNLGGDNSTGSYALGDTFQDFFTLSLQTEALALQSITQQHVIEDIVDLNYGPDEPAPKLVFDEIGAKSPLTAEGIRALIECGALTADDPLEAALRSKFDLPSADKATARTKAEPEPAADPAPDADPPPAPDENDAEATE